MNCSLIALAIVSAVRLLSTSESIAASSQDLPVVTEAKAGPCRMTVYGENSSFLVVVTGLVPGEALKVTSTSEGEVLRFGGTAEDDGRYGTVVVPLVKGKSFSRATLEVIGQRCRIEASFPWRE